MAIMFPTETVFPIIPSFPFYFMPKKPLGGTAKSENKLSPT